MSPNIRDLVEKRNNISKNAMITERYKINFIKKNKKIMFKKFIYYLIYLLIMNNIFPLFASDLMEQHENHHQGTYSDWASSIINQSYPYDKVVLSQTHPIIIEDYGRLARECFNKKDFAGASDYYKMFYLLKGNNISIEDIGNIAVSLYNNSEFLQSALFYDLYLLRCKGNCSPIIYEYAGDAHFKRKDYDLAYKLYITVNCHQRAAAARFMMKNKHLYQENK